MFRTYLKGCIIDLSTENASSTCKVKARNLLFSFHFVHRSITHSQYSPTSSNNWPIFFKNLFVHMAKIVSKFPSSSNSRPCTHFSMYYFFCQVVVSFARVEISVWFSWLGNEVYGDAAPDMDRKEPRNPRFRHKPRLESDWILARPKMRHSRLR